MKAYKESSQMVHTVTIDLTADEISKLDIDRRALPAGFPKIQELLGLIKQAVQPKPTTRSRGGVDPDPNFLDRG